MSAAGRLVALGLVIGVAGGVYMGLAWETLWIGVAWGVASAVFFTLASWHAWGVKAFAGLTFDQRQHVLRTLRQGQAMDDPQLLSAHWQYGSAVLAKPYSRAALYTLSGFVAVLFSGAMVLGLVSEGPGGLLKDLPLVLAALAMIFVGVPRLGRYREQVARSMNATEALVRQLV